MNTTRPPRRHAVTETHALLYLDTLEAAGRSPSTLFNYRKKILPFVEGLDGRFPTTPDVHNYLNAFRSTNHRSVALVIMRQWFKFLRKRGLMKTDPSEGIPLPKRHRRDYAPISEEEFMRLYNELGESRRPFQRPMQVLVTILYRVGPRIAEALSIRVEDVSFEGDYGTISFQKRKGGAAGFAAFGPEVTAILRPYLIGKTGLLFPMHRSESSTAGDTHYAGVLVRGRLRDAGVRAGISGIVTPHRLRHCFCTWAVDSGFSQLALQQQVGHNDPTSTAHYYHPTRKGLLGVYQQARANNLSRLAPTVRDTR